MKNTSKFLCVALASAMLLAMTGCGERAGSSSGLEDDMLSYDEMNIDPRLVGVWTATATSQAKATVETMELKFNRNGTVNCKINEEPRFGTLYWSAYNPTEGMTQEEIEQSNFPSDMIGKWHLSIMDTYDAMSSVYAYGTYTIDGTDLEFNYDGLCFYGPHTDTTNPPEPLTASYKTFTKTGDVPGGGSSGGNSGGSQGGGGSGSQGGGTIESFIDKDLLGTWTGTGTYTNGTKETMELKFNSDGTVTCKIDGKSKFGTLYWSAYDLSSLSPPLSMPGKYSLRIEDIYDGMPSVYANGNYSISGATLEFVYGLAFFNPNISPPPPGGEFTEPEHLTATYTTFTKQ